MKPLLYQYFQSDVNGIMYILAKSPINFLNVMSGNALSTVIRTENMFLYVEIGSV